MRGTGAAPAAMKAISSVRPMGPLVTTSISSPITTSSQYRGEAPRGCSARTSASIAASWSSVHGCGSSIVRVSLRFCACVRSNRTREQMNVATSSLILVGVLLPDVVLDAASGEPALGRTFEPIEHDSRRNPIAEPDRTMERHRGLGVEAAKAGPAELDRRHARKDEAGRGDQRSVD